MPIEIPAHLTQHSDRNPEPKRDDYYKLFVILVGLLIASILTIWFVANALVWWLPPGIERQMGAVIVPIYERQSQPSATQDKLNQLLDQLEAQLPAKHRQGRDYQVFYISNGVVNAAALPGDRILMYKGLLQKAESENEIAMILGHELGHFLNRDHLRGLGTSILLQVMIRGVLGDPGGLATLAVQSAGAVTKAKFSQTQESQADEIGVGLLAGIYGHAAGATDFFERMSQEPDLSIPLLASHPSSARRVATLNQVILQRKYQIGPKTALPSELKHPA